MLASIWLQVSGEAGRLLREVIADLAQRHGTMPFQPHLTVCLVPPDDSSVADAAAAFVRQNKVLPLRVTAAGIAHSAVFPFRAVVLDIENNHELLSFRDELRRITGAPQFDPPHISLLYTIDAAHQTVPWASDAVRLRKITAEAKRLVSAAEFTLDEPIVVAPDGTWANIASWTVLRRF